MRTSVLPSCYPLSLNSHDTLTAWECRGYLLGEQVVHVGDGDAMKQLLVGEHKLVEASILPE